LYLYNRTGKTAEGKKSRSGSFFYGTSVKPASEFSSYFPCEIDYNRKSLKTFFTSIFRPFGTGEVRKKFRRLIKDFKPDILHLNNIHTQLSPVIAQIAYRKHIPVVWTLHDGKLVCPAYLFLSII